MTRRNEPTEGDLLLAELAARGRHAFPGGEGGVSFLIMAIDPGAPDDEDAAYGVPHVLMYAGEQADRPASQHSEPWSAHLHAADGTYLDTLVDGSPEPLDAAADAARCAHEVTAQLRRSNIPPTARRFCTF
ncbi:hypothetical protein OHA84_38060 (plasmid) [Streptomyces sp. NBC_00513]|uniref:hypothetical protein n=1 Tax=unclassified Streptomyces TaxID=2593676 RepID=UPI002259F7FC|nr:hypothetical protein [Streptomyces sp. NBC_00424]MCX5078742.1 hypothetical protein [Streptomyces sp. NBC_00424]WUD46335.1 hypothetical protein OHA84_38060 [Streptomyces sp. NBC_00513]